MSRSKYSKNPQAEYFFGDAHISIQAVHEVSTFSSRLWVLHREHAALFWAHHKISNMAYLMSGKGNSSDHAL